MRIPIRRIGNSRGIIIPTSLLEIAGLELEAEVSFQDGALIVKAPDRVVREGWAQASADLARQADDGLVMPDLGNEDDENLQW